MLLVGVGIAFGVSGFVMFLLTYIFPIFRVVYFDWMGLFLMFMPYVFVMYRLHVTKSMKQADKLPTWKHLINYMRRDNTIIPITGERAYAGESFLDVEHLGLIEFLGKDCVYSWGDKKVMWGLENINYSPDPRYFNLTHLLWELGFRNSQDVKDVLRGKNLYLMGRVYMNMMNYDATHGGGKLVNDMANYEGEQIDFKPAMKTQPLTPPSTGNGRKKIRIGVRRNGNRDQPRKSIIPKDPWWERKRKQEQPINVMDTQKKEEEEEIQYYEPVDKISEEQIQQEIKREQYKQELLKQRKEIDELLKKEAEKNG